MTKITCDGNVEISSVLGRPLVVSTICLSSTSSIKMIQVMNVCQQRCECLYYIDLMLFVNNDLKAEWCISEDLVGVILMIFLSII